MNRSLFLALAAATLMSAGCHSFPVSSSDGAGRAGYTIADALAEQSPADKRPAVVLVAPAFSLGSEGVTSTLGQSLSDAVASRLTHQGFKVVETRTRFPSRRVGEPIARQAVEQAASLGANAVVIGSYSTVDGTQFFVNYRIVRVSDSAVLASTDTVVSYGN